MPEYITEFSLSEEINVNGVDYVLVRAGLKDFDKSKNLTYYALYELIFEPADYFKQYFEKKILVTGNSPAFLIDENSRGKIYMSNNQICIDCGSVFGEKSGRWRLNDLQETYV